ncbi:hypothetical protein L210DRAFT_2909688 [Boletus edulis BED1]|uniref:Uncharacterized protein n=1 Tax=Boletus edulis BED1 TaxID=1328754 RepID=A0AAD4G984_BOLED|nr:hypothetical protein L210DRAFT_2909688 [Boletus edulis BED1]
MIAGRLRSCSTLSSTHVLTFPPCNHLPSPSPSLPLSVFFQQEEPLYTRRCLGCAYPLIWCRWMIRDNDFGRWYTFCDMGEDGCDWFQFVHDEATNYSQQSLLVLHPSTTCKRQRTPSIEILSSPHTQSAHHSWSLSPSQRSLKKQKSQTMRDRTPSLDHSLSSPTMHHRHTSSAAVGNDPSPTVIGSSKPLSDARRRISADHTQTSHRIWPFDFYADEMDVGFTKCRMESNKQRPVEQVFRNHFHVKFTKSTFYDHRRHWMSVSDSVRACYIGYGHTAHGRWTAFLRHEIKGERRMGHF